MSVQRLPVGLLASASRVLLLAAVACNGDDGPLPAPTPNPSNAPATRTTSQTPTPTPTAEPTPTPTLADDLASREVIEFAAAETCVGRYYPLPRTLDVGCAADQCWFFCDHQAGHRGGATLERFRNRFEARRAFDLTIPLGGAVGYAGFEAAFWTDDDSRLPGPPDENSFGALLANCWLAYANAFDDTSFAIAPQPTDVIETIHQRGLEVGLFSRCPLLPPEIQAAGEILYGLDGSPYNQCGQVPLDCQPSGCGFDCTFGPGHEGSMSMTWYASEAEADTAFSERTAPAGQPVESFHGWPAVFWTRDRADLPYADDELKFGAWRAGCWLVYLRAFDDTDLLRAPQPRVASEVIYQKGTAAGIFDRCRPE